MASGPDQGFAWIIAFACFFINFIMAGLARTAGVLYVAIIDLYGVSRESATTPFSIRVCVRNMTGPLVGLLGLKYGIRAVSTIGGFVAAVGSILCYFAPNVFWITIFWGVIHGLGFGLSTVLHMIAINQYFDKYKASALGLGYSGDCFGTFAFPVIMEHLFASYGVRGTFLIIGGIVLNVVPMALLLRKPPWIKRQSKAAKARSISLLSTKHLTLKEHTNSLVLEKNKVLKTCGHAVNKSHRSDKSNLKNPKINNECEIISKCDCNLGGQHNKAFEMPESDLYTLNNEIGIGNLKTQNYNSGGGLEKNENTLDPNRIPYYSSESGRFQNPSCSRDTYLTTDAFPTTMIRNSRSASDLIQKSVESHTNINRSLRLEKRHKGGLHETIEPLTPVPEKENNIRTDSDNSKPEEDEGKKEVIIEIDSSHVELTGILKKRTKSRTSSFVGLVAHELVNRMRTASFVSQVAQDAFVTPIGEEDSESEQELECELTCIVEHKGHDIENCTHRDIILAKRKNVKDDPSKDGVPDAGGKLERPPKPPSVIKVLIRTNTKPMFILISITMAVYAFLFVAVLTIIIDYATDNGISEDRAKYLIIGFSVADLIGRLGFGQVIDRKLIKMKNFSGASLLLMGILTAVIPLNTSFNYTMVCMSMYGLVQGGTAIMFPILVNLYMDKNSESIAMGCLNFYGGLLMLLMAPMIGFFRDNTGSYNCVFYIIGGVVAVVGVAWQFEPMIVKFQNRKLREKYIMKEAQANYLQK